MAVELQATVGGRAPGTTGRRGRLLALRALIPIAVLAAWEASSHGTYLVPPVLPTLGKLVTSLGGGAYLPSLADSLKAAMGGYVIAIAAGTACGLALGRSTALASVFDPIVGGFFAVPRIILYPVLLAALGIGFESKLWLAALSAVFPIMLNTTAGVRDVSPVLDKLGRSLGCTRSQRVRLIFLPAAAPAIMVGLRIGFSIALISTIFAELFAAVDGIGLRLQQAYALQQYASMYAIVVLITAVALVGSLLFWLAEKRMREAFA